jgi:aromatase
MEMDTVTADGSAHTTRSIRLCTAPERIIYKQLLPPALLHGHSGRWDFFAHPEGTRVRATHTVAIKPEAIAGILGPDADLAGAREYLRTALGANSRATLSHAGAHAAGTSAGNPAGNSAGNPAR